MMAEAAVRGAPGHSITGKTWSGPKSIDNSEFHCLAQSEREGGGKGWQTQRTEWRREICNEVDGKRRPDLFSTDATLLRLVSPSQNSSCDVACQDCFRSLRVLYSESENLPNICFFQQRLKLEQ